MRGEDLGIVARAYRTCRWRTGSGLAEGPQGREVDRTEPTTPFGGAGLRLTAADLAELARRRAKAPARLKRKAAPPMKPRVPDLMEKGRIDRPELGPRPRRGEWYGAFVVRGPGPDRLCLIVSAGDPDAWAACGFPAPAFEHVSVGVLNARRCPTWEEMAWVKDLCWHPEECVAQYHPPRSEYVNCHPFVPHLWKPVGVELPRPPAATVGPRREGGRWVPPVREGVA